MDCKKNSSRNGTAADNLLVNLELLIIVSVCGMVLYLINKSIVKGFDFIDTHFINVN